MNKMNERSGFFTRGAFWLSFAFYGLIAFEFFYMFSPFAVYLYALYGPGLDVLSLSESSNWLISFFMPHIARETSSFFITWHEVFGILLFSSGLAVFIYGAVQIYWSKIKKRGAVVKGVYVYIRHPQYVALMVSSLGMVLIWPRYLVLFGFITVCFAYFLLARLEEKICLREFPDFATYKEKTGMFLPQKIENIFSKIPWPNGKFPRILSSITLYLALLLLSFLAAKQLHSLSIHSLYTYSASNEVYLSVGQLDSTEFKELIQVANSDTQVIDYLSSYKNQENRFINYVLPADLFISEIPMHIPEGQTPSHIVPYKVDQNRYKIIFSIAEFGSAKPVEDIEILKRAINKTPVLEVWINRLTEKVEHIFEQPVDKYYEGMPVPLF